MVLKVCKGCGRKMNIAAGRAFCRYCRKNLPKVLPLLWNEKKIDLEEWRKNQTLKLRKHK